MPTACGPPPASLTSSAARRAIAVHVSVLPVARTGRLESRIRPRLSPTGSAAAHRKGLECEAASICLAGQRYEESVANEIGPQRRADEHHLLAHGAGGNVGRSVEQHIRMRCVLRRENWCLVEVGYRQYDRAARDIGDE